MNKKPVLKLLTALVCLTPLAHAEDTEIFFGGQPSGTEYKPNVLFIIDTSGSMLYPVKNSEGKKNQTRLEILQRVFDKLMSNPKLQINAGLMRYQRSYAGDNLSIPNADGSDIYFPITDIDQAVPYADQTPRQLRRYISDKRDDAQLVCDGRSPHCTNTTAKYLNIDANDFALRFQDLPFAKGTKFTEGYLELWTGELDAPKKIAEPGDHEVIYGDTSPVSYNYADVSINNNYRTWTHASTAITRKNSGRLKYNPNALYQSTGYQISGLEDIFTELLQQPYWKRGSNLSLQVDTGMLNYKDNDGSCKRRYPFDPICPPAPRKFFALDAKVKLGFENQVSPASIILKAEKTRAPFNVRDELVNRIYGLDLDGNNGTPTIQKLLDAADYFKNNGNKIVTSRCQKNHIILLTDGRPSRASPATAQAVQALTGQPCSTNFNYPSLNACGKAVAQWLQKTDFSPKQGLNNVTLRTIGFALNKDYYAEQFLNTLSCYGSPRGENDQCTRKTLTAENADELLDALQKQTLSIMNEQTSFVTPGVTVNQFNNYQHENRLYYSMFKPHEGVTWEGNVKAYKLSRIKGKLVIADQDGKPALDDNGKFAINSKSIWSSDVDGNEVRKGGVVENIPGDLNQRKIYTDAGLSAGNSFGRYNQLNDNNGSLDEATLGVENYNEKRGVLDWVRGRGENVHTRRSKIIGDPLHSAPTSITYDCIGSSAADKYKDPKDPSKGCKGATDTRLFFGTNQGFVHSINASNGREEFAYIPEELLPNLNKLRTNEIMNASHPKIYGMDLTPLAWHKDTNNNTIVDGNDKAYIFMGMRRGGRNYYALDVTDPSAPKFAWKILGGQGDFKELGQTWSKPVRGKIKVGSTDRNVLIFGGGYDTKQDDPEYRGADSVGNAIFIVDAETGSLIWKGARNSGNLVFPFMANSIPSEVAAFDVNADGYTDQIIVGDTGGKIWRLFINHGQPAKTLITGAKASFFLYRGIIANLAGAPPAGTRRFFYAPSVSIIKQDNGKRYLTIAIGSGYRPSPLNTVIQDRFYVLKTASVESEPRSVAPQVFTENQLYDVTNNLIKTGNDSQKEAARRALNLETRQNNKVTFKHQGGWFIRLNHNAGQKAITDNLIMNGSVRFMTYSPGSLPSNCNPVSGINHYYSLSLKDGTGTRARPTNVSGISGGVGLVIVDKQDVSPDGEPGQDIFFPGPNVEGSTKGSFTRTFWYDEKLARGAN